MARPPPPQHGRIVSPAVPRGALALPPGPGLGAEGRGMRGDAGPDGHPGAGGDLLPDFGGERGEGTHLILFDRSWNFWELQVLVGY